MPEAHATTVKFPGIVRIEEPIKGDRPLKMRRLTDAKGRLVGTEVTVPADRELEYELEHAKPGGKFGRRGPPKPVAHVTVKPRSLAPVLHADITHEHEVTDHEVRVGLEAKVDPKTKRVTYEDGRMTVQSRKVTGVTATSTTHKNEKGEPLAGTGATAEEATSALRARIAAAEAPKPSPGAGATGGTIAGPPGITGPTGATGPGETVVREG
jgi:hypothetical protein